jgi:hypothetical protein
VVQTTDADRKNTQPRKGAGSNVTFIEFYAVCVQVSAPRGLDNRLVIFHSENDVIMEAEIR